MATLEKQWVELTPDEKREQRFKRWLSPDEVTFNSPEAERLTRLIDAITLKEPDRVPMVFNPWHVPARYSSGTITYISV